ncbi:ankyrin repeat domain-containing protein [Wolbachia endosymbiont of Pentidionis agamae]|uniref:ankyrin repeat domain-containing protein n=1 Tax=Wolbachia endosymbiont of Pentidionis agamae TaxID=3110435 RepID=UPI002FD14B77
MHDQKDFYQTLKDILDNLDKDGDLNKYNIVEKLEEQLEKADKVLCEQWKKAGSNVNHNFELADHRHFSLWNIASQVQFTNVEKVLKERINFQLEEDIEYKILEYILCDLNNDKNLNKDNMVEKIKGRLKEENKALYKTWKKVGFSTNHYFKTANTSNFFSLFGIAEKEGFTKIKEILEEINAEISKREKERKSVCTENEFPILRFILHTLNKDKSFNKDNIVEKFVGKFQELLKKQKEVQLKKEYKVLYDQWEEARFDLNHLFQSNHFKRSLLHLAAIYEFTNIMDTLIQNNVNVNILDHNSSTPLFLAVLYERKNAVKILIENNADVNINNSLGFSPFYQAVMKRHPEIVKSLINHVYDIHELDAYGRTPLSYIMQYTDDGSREIKRLLVDRIAELEIFKLDVTEHLAFKQDKELIGSNKSLKDIYSQSREKYLLKKNDESLQASVSAVMENVIETKISDVQIAGEHKGCIIQ